jgi:hypothetical protein
MMFGLSCVRLIAGGRGGIVINNTPPLVRQEFLDPTRSANNDIGALEYGSLVVFCGGGVRGNEEQGAGWSPEPKEGETARVGCAERNWVTPECI